jgi:hypothetical protein
MPHGGRLGVFRGGSFAGVVGMRRVVGIGGVFARVFLVGQLVMGEFFAGAFFVAGFLLNFRTGRLGYGRRRDR